MAAVKKKCVIFGSMPAAPALRRYAEGAALVIAVDRGYEHAMALGIKPQLLCGDFDSLPRPVTDIETMELPTHKDVTDTYFAAQQAVERGCGEVVILGGTGGRLYHTVANLHTLCWLAQQGVAALLADEGAEVRALWQASLTLARRENWYLSLFPTGSRAGGVSVSGVEYPLSGAELVNTYPVGVSNEFTGPQAQITVREGGLYVILARR